MAKLSADQRNYYFLLEAERTGIHKPILAALYAVQGRPALADGEVGLGAAPVNRIPPEQLNSFGGQVQYVSNTIRSITSRLTAIGWRGTDIWSAEKGRYTDRFLQAIAEGYTPPASDISAILLEPCSSPALIKSYLEDLTRAYQADQLPQNLSYLDGALLTFTERTPRYYSGLAQERQALLEACRIWRKLDTRQAAINSLLEVPPNTPLPDTLDEAKLDQSLIRFSQDISRNYAGFPHQREALIRLVQFWRQLDSREETILSLRQTNSAETNIGIIDPALVSFVQRIPQFYRGTPDQRNALTECFRLWRELDSRSSALFAMGINPEAIASATDPEQLTTIAVQLDRELLGFVKRVPVSYQETERQREALIRLVQLWRRLDARDKTLQSLLEDVRQMQRARPNSPDAAPPPNGQLLPPRPSRWTPSNIQLFASILPNGNFTWAEATHGGTRMPDNQATVDAIVRIATLAQEARNRIGRSFHITSWYRPPAVNQQVGGASESRHIVGDAIDFYCDGLTGDQLYWSLDPWWTGGLGRYTQYPYLCHLDARGYRSRWKH